MIVSLIVAASLNNAIGKAGKLLWHLPNDMAYFKNVTWGMPVIMGRKTYESLKKPLSGRTNIVITRQTGWNADGVITATDIGEAIDKAKTTNAKEIFCIGGGDIFKQMMDRADKIYLTRVKENFQGDAFFPELDETIWKLTSQEDFEADEKNHYPLSFQIWEKK